MLTRSTSKNAEGKRQMSQHHHASQKQTSYGVIFRGVLHVGKTKKCSHATQHAKGLNFGITWAWFCR